MNSLNHKNLFLVAALVLLAVFGLGAAIQFQNLNNGTDPIVDTSQKNGPSNSVYATWGDYDLDGDDDLYVVNNGSPNHLYRNNTCSYDLPCESISHCHNRDSSNKFYQNDKCRESWFGRLT